MRCIVGTRKNKIYFVVSYDISNNKLRSKIAKLLEGYGVRVQYSVFECKIEFERYRQLYYQLKELSKTFEEDSIRIYRICKNCEEEIETLGKVKKELEVVNEGVIVF